MAALLLAAILLPSAADAAGPAPAGGAWSRPLDQDPTWSGVYFDLQTNSTAGNVDVFASGRTRFFMRMWEDTGDLLTVAAPYDVMPDNQLRLCYRIYNYAPGDPLNTSFWTTLAQGWLYLVHDQATFSGIGR